MIVLSRFDYIIYLSLYQTNSDILYTILAYQTFQGTFNKNNKKNIVQYSIMTFIQV